VNSLPPKVLPSGELLTNARQAVDSWSQLAGHPGLSCPREVFVTADLDGSPSLVVAHPYYPGAVTMAQVGEIGIRFASLGNARCTLLPIQAPTLTSIIKSNAPPQPQQAHLMPTQTASGLVRNAPNEAVLWSYTIQLAAALRAVHAAGLAVRPACLSPSKVLVLPLGRLRVGSLGVVEALGGDVNMAGEELLQAQRDDVVVSPWLEWGFGFRVPRCTACIGRAVNHHTPCKPTPKPNQRQPTPTHHPQAMGQVLLTLSCSAGGIAVPNLDYAAAHFSSDYVRCLALLLGAGEGGAFSWRHMAALAGERMMMEVDQLAAFNDNLVGGWGCLGGGVLGG
jgi:hypothetical protein